MSLDRLERWAERRISRRSLLKWSTRGSLGVAALLLVGCDDDDDDATATAAATETARATAEPTDTATAAATATATATATAEPTDTATTTATATEEPSGGGGIATGGPIIEQVVLGGADATMVILNTGDTPASLAGWFLCNGPSYWPFPAGELAPGARLTVHAGAGTDSTTELFAGGSFGSLAGGDGEIALYSSNAFGSADAIVSYVGWGSAKGRLSVARAAGIWGEATLEPATARPSRSAAERRPRRRTPCCSGACPRLPDAARVRHRDEAVERHREDLHAHRRRG